MNELHDIRFSLVRYNTADLMAYVKAHDQNAGIAKKELEKKLNFKPFNETIYQKFKWMILKHIIKRTLKKTSKNYLTALGVDQFKYMCFAYGFRNTFIMIKEISRLQPIQFQPIQFSLIHYLMEECRKCKRYYMTNREILEEATWEYVEQEHSEISKEVNLYF